MIRIFIFICMVFCHIVDDYYLQGQLAQLKQKQWWKEHTDNELYKYDYLMALFMHSFSWAFMIEAPIIVYWAWMDMFSAIRLGIYTIALVANIVCHFYVDNLKANERTINLVDDQLMHLAQITITCGFLTYV